MKALCFLAILGAFAYAGPSWAATNAAPQSAGATAAQRPAPVQPIAIYPGGKVNMEVSLTKDDLLPVLVEVFKKTLGGQKQQSLANALSGVTAVHVIQIAEIPTSETAEKILSYYTSRPEVKKLRNVFRSRDEGDYDYREVYSGPGGSGLYGLWLSQSGESPGWVLRVGRVDGKLNLADLVDYAQFSLTTGKDGAVSFGVGTGSQKSDPKPAAKPQNKPAPRK